MSRRAPSAYRWIIELEEGVMILAYPLDDPQTATPPHGLSEAVSRLGDRVAFDRNAEIYAQDDPAAYLYQVVGGTVRTMRLTSDGRRQVGDFYHPGDLFGLEPGASHRFAAEALTPCVVLRVGRAAVRAAVGEHRLHRAVLDAAREELARLQDHVLLLGRKSAREKVAGFLLQAAHRQPDGAVMLPMGRQDMADYLGLTIETVCRMLTQLQGESIVEFANCRQFRVTRPDALEDMAA